MQVSYEELLVDVVRYKSMCDEGLQAKPQSLSSLPELEKDSLELLAERVAADIGIGKRTALRGVVYAACKRRMFHEGFFSQIARYLYT